MLEDYDRALALDKKMLSIISYVANALLYYDYISWHILLHLAVLPNANKDETETHLKTVHEKLPELDFVTDSPFLAPQICLIHAELARVEGDAAVAQQLYTKAIEKAKEAQSQRLIGYANEQAMKFHLSQKKEKLATAHFREARAAYFAWGAYAKTKQLEQRYAPLAGQLNKSISTSMYTSASGFLPPAAEPQIGNIDLNSVLKACQILSSEMDFTKLLHNMIRIVIQNTGAQRGFFIVPDENGKLFVEVQGDSLGNCHLTHVDISTATTSNGLSPTQGAPVNKALKRHKRRASIQRAHNYFIRSSSDSSISLDKPAEQSPTEVEAEPITTSDTTPATHSRKKSFETDDLPTPQVDSPLLSAPNKSTLLPAGMLQYVYKTKTHVLLSDAASEGTWAFEPHIQQHNTKSVLCVPALYQNQVVAILYVENNLMSGVFTTERLEVAQMLSAQIGISFQNAKLYTDLQGANKLLEHKNKSLIEYDQIKDQFLANTSHELRTPLNGIIGLAESLLDNNTDPANSTSTLKMIVSCGKRLSNLVNDILDYNALRVGTLNFNAHPTDLTSTVAEVVSVSLPLIGAKKIKLINKVTSLPVIHVDAPRIQQVLQNIIGNAIKFTEKGQIVVDSEVTDDWVSFIISDTGCGIPESLFGIVFEEFKQVDGSISREVGGTGLGLPISKKIVELHRGAIYFESEVGKGSVFRIVLPNRALQTPPIKFPSASPTGLSKFAPSSSTLAVSPSAMPRNSSILSPPQTFIARAPPSILSPTLAIAHLNNHHHAPRGPISPPPSVITVLPPPEDSAPPPIAKTPPTDVVVPLPTHITPKTSVDNHTNNTTNSSKGNNQATTPVTMTRSTSTTPPPIISPPANNPNPTYTAHPLLHPIEDSTNPQFTVLSVDDDESNQIVIKKLLGKKFSIVTAMNGQEALDKINEGLIPDLILLDVMMPKMSGLEVCEILRKKYPLHQLPIIMVSAKNKPADVVEGLSKGANDYVGKPINKDELVARMATQLTISLSCRILFKPNGVPTAMCAKCQSQTGKDKDIFERALESQNVLAMFDKLPYMLTLCDLDDKVILRNKKAKDVFNSLLGTDETKSVFLPHAKTRASADAIFSAIKTSEPVRQVVPVTYGGQDFNHIVQAQLIDVHDHQSNCTRPLIMLLEEVDKTPAPASTKANDSQTTPTLIRHAPKATQTIPINIVTSSRTAATQTHKIEIPKPDTPPAGTPPTTSPRASLRTTTPRATSPIPVGATPAMTYSTSSSSAVKPTSPTHAHANQLVIQPVSPVSPPPMQVTTPVASATGTPPDPFASSLVIDNNVLSLDQVLDYVDNLHSYINVLERDRKEKGLDAIPQMIRTNSLPSKFKSKGIQLKPRPPVPPLSFPSSSTPNSARSNLSSSLNTPNGSDNLPPYVIPTNRYETPRSLTSSSSINPLASSQSSEYAPYFTRSSFTTPIPEQPETPNYFTLSSYDSNTPRVLSSAASYTPRNFSVTPRHSSHIYPPREALGSSATSLSQPQMASPPPLSPNAPIIPKQLRKEIQELQTQLHLKQALLATHSFRVRFRLANIDFENPENDKRRDWRLMAAFYSTVELGEPSSSLLYDEIAKKLGIAVEAILVLVRDEVVVTDEEIEDGIYVDVYLAEQF